MVDVLDLRLDGRFAGKLMRGELDQVEFLYDEGYLDNRNTTPLSASMPKSAVAYGPDVVMPLVIEPAPRR